MNPLSDLIEDGLSSADGRAELVKLATRLIVEEALEAESHDALDRDYYEHGESPGQGWCNGVRTGRLKTAEGLVDYTADEREQYHREFGKLAVDGMLPRAFAEWTAPYCFSATTLARNRPLVDHWIERWTATIPARAVLFQGRSWIDKKDITGQLDAIHLPALVIHGEEDSPIPIERALPMVDALPDATLARIPQAGHSVNLEAPAAVNTAIVRFLNHLDLS